jgi:hypothetical protein
MIVKLYDASTGAVASTTIQSNTSSPYGNVGLDVGASAAGVYTIQGRFSSAGTWQVIATIDATTPSKLIALFPFIRAVKSSGTDHDIFLRY